MASVYGWFCLTHNTFLADTQAVNNHIDSLPTLLSHDITGVARITEGSDFPPSGPSPFLNTLLESKAKGE